jgi:hypothetical protein
MREMTAALVVGVLVAAGAPAETPDEVIARYLAARGGSEKVAAVRTVRLQGKLGDAPMTVELSRPDKMRVEISFPKGTLLRIYNSGTAWQINPFAVDKGVVTLSGEDLRYASEEADEDAFVDYRAKGHRVEVVGGEEVEGHAAIRLRVTLRNGDVHDDVFDVATGLKLKWEAARHLGNSEVVLESFFSDYRPVGGVLFPFRIESGRKGDRRSQALAFESIEVNVPLATNRFDKPAAPPVAVRHGSPPSR